MFKSMYKKTDEIHNYFIKLENIMFEITEEECNELKLQLEQTEINKNREIEEKLYKQKELEKENFLLKKIFNNWFNILY